MGPVDLVLHSDLNSTGLLGHFVAAAVHVAILTAREAIASLWKWATRLSLRTALLLIAVLAAVFIVRAEGAVRTDWAWVLVP